MSDDIQALKDASAETQEILKELEEEGHEIAGQPKADPEATKPEEKPEEKPVEPTKEDDAPSKEPETKPEKPERQEKYVPVGKHNEERHKRQEAERRAEEAANQVKELQAQIAGLSNKPTGEQMDDVREAATKIAEKHGLDSQFVNEFAETIVDIASKRNVLPKEIEAKLASFEQIRAKAEAQELERAQEAGFENEFKNITKEFPDLANRKEDLKQLAFSEGNTNTSLRRLALEYLHDNPAPAPGKKTAETSSHGRVTQEVVDFENITEEQFANLSMDQLELYEKWLEKKK